jgi:ATP-dependent DNA helicase RecG
MRKETQTVEFKQSWRDEYLKWICGFANAHGGKLLIGMDDAGMAVGVPNARKLMEDIPNKIRDTMGIVADVSLRKRQGKDVIEIAVRESDFPVAYRGEYHYRTGSTKQQLTGFALTQFLFHKMHLSWDGAETAGRLAFRKYTFKRLALRYEEKTGRTFKPTWFVSTGLSTKDGVLTNSGGASETSQHPAPESVASHETASETINETISETIKSRPGITRAELIALLGRSRSTVARAIANLVATGKIERRGSKKTGGYFVKDS